jgi:hypothetical protein
VGTAPDCYFGPSRLTRSPACPAGALERQRLPYSRGRLPLANSPTAPDWQRDQSVKRAEGRPYRLFGKAPVMEQRSATYYIFTVLPPAGREALRVLFRDLPADLLPLVQIGVFRHLAPAVAPRHGGLRA